MRLSTLIIYCLMSFSGSAQETSEIRFGTDITPSTQHLTLGFKKTFQHNNLLLTGATYFNLGYTDEYSVQFGMGYKFTNTTSLTFYPVWYRHFIERGEYLTPVSLYYGYALPGSMLLFEAGTTYMDRSLYPQFRVTYGIKINGL